MTSARLAFFVVQAAQTLAMSIRPRDAPSIMSRAAFPPKTTSELRDMSLSELEQYIGELRLRAQVLRGPARKATEKRLATAEKERASR
ncbi:MAG TPA: hypothetical protein VHO25_09765 [Polyangiaceae bacterium]|nr:hypothetical protein [Polyangiaceae bacterium]